MKDIENLTFEEAMGELEVITKNLDVGEVSLSQYVEMFARSHELKKHCESKLKDAKLKVERIVSQDEEVKGLEASELEKEYDAI